MFVFACVSVSVCVGGEGGFLYVYVPVCGGLHCDFAKWTSPLHP